MESLSAFPPVQNNSGAPDSRSWTSISSHIEAQDLRHRQLGIGITAVLHRAYAALIWTFTGDLHVGFLSSRLSQGTLHDLAVRQYEIHPDASDLARGRIIRPSACTEWKSTQSGGGGSSSSILVHVEDDDEMPRGSTHPNLRRDIPFQIFYSSTPDHGVEILFWYVSTCLTDFHVELYARQLHKLTKAILDAKHLDDFRIAQALSVEDESYLMSRTRESPELVSRCIHDCITEHADRDGSRIAVDAWDGRLTREELESEADRLSTILLQAGVQSKDTVLILMDKAKVVSVAVLAVLQLGATFMLLDPSLPAERLEAIASKAKASHAITTQFYLALACSLVPSVVVQDARGEFIVADNGEQRPEAAAAHRPPRVSPTDTAFYICTSGSSGIPKLIATSHAAWVTASLQTHQYGVTDTTRVFQYASFSFAVSIIDIVTTLIVGGTVCIPGPQERLNDIDGAIRRLQPTFACMTSSIAGIVKPSDVPSITTLLLVGEPVQRSVAAAWLVSGTITVRNGYGQSEACGHNSTVVLSNSASSYRSIGNSGWLDFWVVDPADHDRLMPIGAVGELLIEGHSIADGYVDDPKKTMASFIEAPAWAARMKAGLYGRRWYKTGDLVQYQHNGELILFGRKDSQLKIYGQRVEAADVEYHISANFDNVQEVVVDKVGTESSQRLIAFISLREYPTDASHDAERLQSRFHDCLASKLPKWMIPAQVILKDKMPRTATGKLDRRALRSTLCQNNDTRLSSPSVSTKQQETCAEDLRPDLRLLISLCSQALNISAEHMSPNSNWIAIGGDSLSAMALVRTARDVGFALTTADLMSGRELQELCSRASPLHTPPCWKPENGTQNGAAHALPLTDFQKEYLPPADGRSRGSLYKFDICLRGQIEMIRLKQALATWMRCTEALRLSFTRCPFGALSQSVLEADSELWQCRLRLQLGDEDVDAISRTHDFLTHPVLVMLCGRDSGCLEVVRLALHVSHSIFDGLSLDLLIEDLVTAYTTSSVPPRPTFTKYLQGRSLPQSQESIGYWRQLLNGSSPTYLRRSMGTSSASSDSTRSAARVVFLRQDRMKSAPMSSLVHAAWALVLSVLAGQPDVIFLYLVHGRDEAVEGSDTVIGCCTSEVPCRAQLADTMTSADLVNVLRSQTLQSIPHAHLGSNSIASKCTEWERRATIYDHSSFVQHHGLTARRSVALGDSGYVDVECPIVEEDMNYDFDLRTSSTSSNDLAFELRCLAASYSAEELEAVARAFVEAMRLLTSGNELNVGEIKSRIRSIPFLPVVTQPSVDPD